MRNSPIDWASRILSFLLAVSTSGVPAEDLGLDAVDCLGTLDVTTHPRTVACQTLILPSNHNSNVLEEPAVVTVRFLALCQPPTALNVTFGYSRFTHFNPQVLPGPGFALVAPPKKVSYTEQSFELERVSPGETSEVLFTLVFDKVLPGKSHIAWLNFQVDGGEDISESIPQASLESTNLPSKPVLAPPAPILSTSVQVDWFPNPTDENVTSYLAIVTDSTTEVSVAQVSPPTTTAVLDGLQPGTDYELSLLAANMHGKGEATTVPFTTRFDRLGSQADTVIQGLSRDWNPSGTAENTVEGAVLSPVDVNLDRRVNAEDALIVIRDHLQRVR